MARSTTVRARRRRAWEAQKGRCCYCAQAISFEEATLEHVVPRAMGGTNDPRNLKVACLKCNHRRGSEMEKQRRESWSGYAPSTRREGKIRRLRRHLALQPGHRKAREQLAALERLHRIKEDS